MDDRAVHLKKEHDIETFLCKLSIKTCDTTVGPVAIPHPLVGIPLLYLHPVTGRGEKLRWVIIRMNVATPILTSAGKFFKTNKLVRRPRVGSTEHP